MKNGKRLIALLLCIVMCASLLPVPTLADEGTIEVLQEGTIAITEETSSTIESNDPVEEAIEETAGKDPFLSLLDDFNNIDEVVNLEEIVAPETGAYYYNQLSLIEKKIYCFFAPLRSETKPFYIAVPNGYSSNEFETVIRRSFEALIADQPVFHMYWQRNVNVLQEDGLVSISLNRMPCATEYLISKSEARLADIIGRIDLSADRYTKLMDLGRIVATEMNYDYSYEVGGTSLVLLNDCATGVLAYNLAVCGGYAQFCKLICDAIGVPCIEVGNIGHAWNYVLMEDDNWYAYDLTTFAGVDVEQWFASGGTWPLPNTIRGSQTEEYLLKPYSWSEVCFQYDFSFPSLSETAYIYTGQYTDTYAVPGNYEEPEGRFIYNDNGDGTCTITSYEGNQSGDLVIPDTINGLPVTIIGENAFLRCKGFTGSILIPDSVVRIEQNAFMGCSEAAGRLQLPSNLRVIQDGAFCDCLNLSGSLVLPDSVEIIGAHAFRDCKGFTGQLVFPGEAEWDPLIFRNTQFNEIIVLDTSSKYSSYDGVLYDKDQTTLLFCPRTKTGELIIPDTVKTIRAESVRDCLISGRLTLPENLETIEADAFYNTKFVGDLVIPNSVKTIGGYAFYYSRKVPSDGSFSGSISVGNSVESIGRRAFEGCSFNSTLSLPNTLIYIGDYAFLSCRIKGTLLIPDCVEYIGAEAFVGNRLTGTLNVPFSTKLGKSAFLGNHFTGFSCGCNMAYEETAYSPCGVEYQCPNCGGAFFEGSHEFGCWIEETFWDGWENVDQIKHSCRKCGYEEAIKKGDVETTPEIGHVFQVNWIWNGNYTSAEAQLSCEKGDFTERIDAVITSECTEPTCEQNGKCLYTASVCFENLIFMDSKTEVLLALGHQLVNEASNSVTCEIDGNSEYWICTRCGKYFSDAEGRTEIAENSWLIPATGHTEVVDAAVAATCTETGLTEGKHCSVCGKVLVAQEMTPAPGHNWNAAVYTWSVDNSKVTATAVCANDASHVTTETVATTYEVTKEPTENETGIGVYTADFISELFIAQTREEVIPKIEPRVQIIEVATSTKGITLSWSVITGADAYILQRRLGSGSWVTQSATLKEPSFTDTEVQMGMTYCYRVAAVTGNTHGEFSEEAEILFNPFSDVAASGNAFKYVSWAYNNGVVTGTSDTTFTPSGNCTKVQFVMMLWKMNGSPVVGGENPFSDISGKKTINAILWALDRGIVNSGSRFNPNSRSRRSSMISR